MSAAPKPNIDICAACGKLHARVYVRLCAACAVVEQNRFELVRAHLREHEEATIPEIAEYTGLSRGEVARFYEEGRLVDSGADGQPAKSQDCTCAPGGQRCLACRRRLSRKFDAFLDGGDRSRRLGELLAEDDDGHKRVQYIRRARRDEE